MKKTFTTLTCLFFAYFLQAQPTLEYKTHGVKAGAHTTLLKADHVSPGAAGSKAVWDFRNLNLTGAEEINEYSNISEAPQIGFEQSANIAAKVSDDYTIYFNVNDKEHTQVGYAGKDYTVTFSQPMKRMIYPFSFGENFSGSFIGIGAYKGGKTDIAGNYTVEADAYGTLLLPNNITLKNVLRVKTVMDKNENQACYSSTTHQVKYLFYDASHCYPVFAIMESDIMQSDKTTTKVYYSGISSQLLIQKAQNAQAQTESNGKIAAAKQPYTCNVYPNPFSESFSIELTLTSKAQVSMHLFSEDGKSLGQIMNSQVLDATTHTVSFNGNHLSSGNYFIICTVGENTFVKRIISVKK